MLRDWNGESNELLFAALKQFGVEPEKIRIRKYEAISPDSFIWMLTTATGNNYANYFLYAEDYVTSLDEVTSKILNHRSSWNPDDSIELVPSTDPQKWEQADPVKAADYSTKPERSEEFIKYTATSGYDWLFLAKVIQN